MPEPLPTAGDPLWYRDAAIYQVHVRSFFDSNGDGIGDFIGLTEKLDYIHALGVSAVWLLPFYPSPLRDDGYDIGHYEGVHPHYGTRRDFLAFLNAAHDRGLKVITELVINHTSDQHPWFQAARQAKRGTSKRDFYVWSDTDQKYPGVPIVFKDTERSNWTWDAVAEQYFWHRFFHHQPDLNFDNPSVLKAVLKVMRFWLDMGVDGMRLDAVPYLIERDGTQCANLPETHAVLKTIRRELDARYTNRMLLAEANQWPSDVRAYFGDGDECHMAFHFPLMPRLFMALRQEDRHPLSEILYQMPDIPDTCQWAIFLRNHDELTLEMVSDEERDYMYEAYAADPAMRLNAGIRRRLAPLMENSRPRIELMTALLLSLPGTPVLYYGDELGMGDNVYLGDRNGVRTPMQWNADRNGGFSRADPARLYAPPIMDSVYGYASVNVEAQERSSHSLLAWMRRIIALRQRHATFGRGTLDLLRPANRRVFAFIRRYESEDPILVVANLSRTVEAASLDLNRFDGLVPVEMFGGVDLPRIGKDPYPLTLGPHAFYWLKLQRDAPARDGGRPRPITVELEPEQSPLLLGPEWSKILDTSARQALERLYLPAFLRRQPWFDRRSSLAKVEISDWATLRNGTEPIMIAMLTATFSDADEARYVLPVAVTPDEAGETIARESPEAVIVRMAGARKGVMHARLDGPAGRALVQTIIDEGETPLRSGRLLSQRFEGFAALGLPDRMEAVAQAPPDAERFHSYASFGEKVVLKVVRRVWPGPNPELEIERFLTTETAFSRVPRPAGVLEYRDAAGTSATIAHINGFLPRQTNAWRHAVGELERFVDLALALDPPVGQPGTLHDLWATGVPTNVSQAMGAYAQVAGRLGHRVAELHAALEGPEAARRFGTAELSSTDVDNLTERVGAGWERARAAVTAANDHPETVRGLLQPMLDRHEEIGRAIRSIRQLQLAGLPLTRTHGSLDLAHILHYEGDFSFIGPEDDGARSVAERQRLRSPLEDVANVIRSFQSAGTHMVSARRSAVPQLPDRVEVWTRWWVAGAVSSFLRTYRDPTPGRWPSAAKIEAVAGLVWLFAFEKSCEEIRRSVGAGRVWMETAILGATEILNLKTIP